MVKYAAAALLIAARPVTAEPACSTSAVRARAAQLLGRTPLEQFTVEIDGGGHTGRVTFDQDRVRTVTAASCSELVENMALVVAMAVQSLPVQAAPDVPDPSHSVPAPPIRITVPQASDETLDAEGIVVPEDREEPLRLEQTTGAAVGWSSRRVDEQLAVGARIHSGWRSLGLAARLAKPYDVALGDAAIHISAVAFTADPCAWGGSWSVCATATAGWITGRGEHLYDAVTERLLNLELGGRIGWEMRVTSAVALRATFDLEVPLLRDRFLVDRMPIWQSGVEAWLGAAALVQIP